MDKKYWEALYHRDHTGWDVGYATHPIAAYIDQLTNQSLQILLPGAGNGHEAEYLYRKGFCNTYLLDFAKGAINNFTNRLPEFPSTHIIHEDFFAHQGQYDLIIEHTFFSSILINKRTAYMNKMYDLLTMNGKLVGLLFNHEFGNDHPPFGGTENLYRQLFGEKFKILKMEIAYNSIKPRRGRELFFMLEKQR